LSTDEIDEIFQDTPAKDHVETPVSLRRDTNWEPKSHMNAERLNRSSNANSTINKPNATVNKANLTVSIKIF
jgi:hypothetical protein